MTVHMTVMDKPDKNVASYVQPYMQGLYGHIRRSSDYALNLKTERLLCIVTGAEL